MTCSTGAWHCLLKQRWRNGTSLANHVVLTPDEPIEKLKGRQPGGEVRSEQRQSTEIAQSSLGYWEAGGVRGCVGERMAAIGASAP